MYSDTQAAHESLMENSAMQTAKELCSRKRRKKAEDRITLDEQAWQCPGKDSRGEHLFDF